MPQYLVVQGLNTHNSQRLPRFSPGGRSLDGAALWKVAPVTTRNR